MNLIKKYYFLGLLILFGGAFCTCRMISHDPAAKPAGLMIHWQAHRGGGAHDAPDNTMAAFQYAWSLGGIPEADIRTTLDSVIICLHDGTLARTTDAPAPIASVKIRTLRFEQVRRWDAGIKFDSAHQGERVPSLAEVFAAMKGFPQRQLYLDLKDVDLKKLGRMIDSLNLGKQILIASSHQDECRALKGLARRVRTMLWIGGSAGEIEEKFKRAADNGFDGLDQVQLHLNDNADSLRWRYELSPEFIEQAVHLSKKCGRDLEVFVKEFDERSVNRLLDMGIRWYATDEPKRFAQIIEGWQKR